MQGHIQLSLLVRVVDDMESKASFWGIFKARGAVAHYCVHFCLTVLFAAQGESPVHVLKAGDAMAAAAEGDDMGALKAVFVHFRPIINNIFRLLYVLVRPIMLFLLSHRR